MQLDAREFLVAFLPGENRVLTRTGVEIHRLQYWAAGLEQWVGQYTKVSVHYDPRDITYVYVRSPSGLLVKAPVTTPGVSAISLAEWSARRQSERAASRDPARVEAADASLKRNDAFVKQAKASRKERRRKATAAAGDRNRDTSCPSPPAIAEAIEEIPVHSEALQPFVIEEPDHDI